MERLDEIINTLESDMAEPKFRPALIFLDDVDKVRKQSIYQIWNQIVDCFDNLEKKNKKERYSAEDVRKKVKAICTRSIISPNKMI